MFHVKLSTKFFHIFNVPRETYNAHFLLIVDNFYILGIKSIKFCHNSLKYVEIF